MPAPKDSLLLKFGAVGMAFVMMTIASGGLVWALAIGLNNKADKTELQKVRNYMYEIHTAVEVIKTEQRMLIHYIDPTLPVGP